MVVCKFFAEGYCKFGGRCKFEHVDPYRGYDSPDRPQGTSILKAATSSFGGQDYSRTPQQSYGQSQPQNFSQHSFSHSPQHSFNQTPQHSFHQTPQHGFNTPQQSSFGQKPSGLKYNVQEIMQIVLRDITQLEKGGQWQLSCYSPLKELPNMPGLDDYSQEELRWECYKALQNGSLPLCQVIVQQLFGNVAKMNNDLKRKDTGYSIIDRWLRDSEQQKARSVEQPAPAFASPFAGSSNTGSAFGSPLFSSNEPQQHPTQPAASSFSFSLPPQQLPTSQPFQQNSPFSNQTSSGSLFSNNQNSASVFPSNQSSPFSSNQATSAFASQNPSPLSASRTPVVDSQAYSTNEALTEAELKSFQADRFTLGSIPTKSPPRALCNL